MSPEPAPSEMGPSEIGAERDGAERDGAERDGAERDGAERDGAERDGAEARWGRARWGRARWGRARWGRARWGPRGPIFIGGLSGSGKTQLRLVLGAHPDISMTRRSYLWNRFYGRFGSLDDPENFERCLAVMAADRDVQRLDPDWVRIRRELLAGQPNDARLIGLLHDHYAAAARQTAMGRAAAVRRSASRIRSSPTFRTPA